MATRMPCAKSSTSSVSGAPAPVHKSVHSSAAATSCVDSVLKSLTNPSNITFDSELLSIKAAIFGKDGDCDNELNTLIARNVISGYATWLT